MCYDELECIWLESAYLSILALYWGPDCLASCHDVKSQLPYFTFV